MLRGRRGEAGAGASRAAALDAGRATRFRRRARAAGAAVVAREEASALRADPIAVVSHELREPLNGILGMARLLRDTPLDREQSEYLTGRSRLGGSAADARERSARPGQDRCWSACPARYGAGASALPRSGPGHASGPGPAAWAGADGPGRSRPCPRSSAAIPGRLRQVDRQSRGQRAALHRGGRGPGGARRRAHPTPSV